MGESQMRCRWPLVALVSGVAGLIVLPILWIRMERGSEVEHPMVNLDRVRPQLVEERYRTTVTSSTYRDPVQLSNLSASYLIRADQENEPGHLVRALEFSTNSISLDPLLTEALFNRALAMDQLALRYKAERAWSDYLRADSESPWARIAQKRRDELRKPSESEFWHLQAPELRKAVDEGDVVTIRDIVKGFTQPARELVLEDVLGRWGDQFLAGDMASASSSSRMASAVGAALRHTSGDRSIEAVAIVVARAQEAPLELWAAELARSHRAFREGTAAFRRSATNEAGRWFAEAMRGSRQSGSPITLWAAAGRARVEAYNGDHASADEQFKAILAEAYRHRFISLVGWCEWGLGWIESRRGDFTQATRHFVLAEEAFRQTREVESLGAIATYLGENLASLGQQQEAWRYRQLALKTLYSRPTSLRRHVALMDASWEAMKEGLASAGLAFQDEALLTAEQEGSPVRLAEANWARSRILTELGRSNEARQALRKASEYTNLVPAGAPRAKIEADLAWAQGDVLRRLNPEEALPFLTTAIQAYEELKVPVNLAYAFHSRAQLLLRAGSLPQAEDDLNRSLRTLEEMGTQLEEEDLRISYSESIQDIYDNLIHYRWVRDRDPSAALAGLERARGLGPASEEEWTRISESIASDFVIIDYALLEDRLLIWIVNAKGIQGIERPVERSRLERLVQDFRKAIQRGDRSDRLETLSSALYDLLIPPTLGQGHTLCFIPDKVLNQVPFAALFNRRTRRFLVQDYAIALAPSLAYTRSAGEPPNAPSSILLVADPTINDAFFPSLPKLSGARAEMKSVKSLFPFATLLQGDEATKDRLLDELSRAEIFAFSGHAFSHSTRPSRSHLVVAPSPEAGDPGMLLAGDLAGRSFERLWLVVLSACTSVGPRSARSTGIAGMARPFLQAGVDSVIGSLWPIEDRKADSFTRPFYQYIAAGISPVESLRRAQLRALKGSNGSWVGVSTWSAFVCVVGTIKPKEA